MDLDEEVDYSPDEEEEKLKEGVPENPEKETSETAAVNPEDQEGKANEGNELDQILDYQVEEEFANEKETEEESPKPASPVDVKIDFTVNDYFSDDLLYKHEEEKYKDGSYKVMYIIGDSRVRPLASMWPSKYRNECPSIVSVKNLTFSTLKSTVEEHCNFADDGKNLLICSLGIHDILELAETNHEYEPMEAEPIVDQSEDQGIESTTPPEEQENVEADQVDEANSEEQPIPEELPQESSPADDDVKNEHRPIMLPDLSDPENSSYVCTIVEKMKTFKSEMKELSVDVVFTDIIPVDLQRIQEFQLNTSNCKKCKELAWDSDKISTNMERMKNIIASIHDDIVKEQLHQLKDLSSTWILVTDENITDYNADDGINLKAELLHEMMKKVSKLCSYFFSRKRKLDYKDDEPRGYVSREKIDVSYLPPTKAYRTYKRVIIAGDYWLEPIIDLWPRKDDLKPTFAVLNRLGVEGIINKLEAKYDLNNTLLILSVGTNDIFDYLTHDDCANHRPLKFPVVQHNLLKSPAAFAGRLWARISSLKNKVEREYIGTNIIYLTIYPMNFVAYLKHLTREHYEKTYHQIDSLMDHLTLSRVSKNLPIAFQQINMWINEDSQTNSLPTWGINKILNVKGSEKTVVFPEVNVKVSVANKVIVKFQTLIEQSNPLDDHAIHEAEVCRKKGVTHIPPHEQWIKNEQENNRSRSKSTDIKGRLSNSGSKGRRGSRDRDRSQERDSRRYDSRRARSPDRARDRRPYEPTLPGRLNNKELNRLYENHKKEFKKYRLNPELHPMYEEERNTFFDIQYMQQYNVQDNSKATDKEAEWRKFWLKRLDKMFDEEWEVMKREALKNKQNEDVPGEGSIPKRRKIENNPSRGVRVDQSLHTLETIKILSEIGDKLGPMAKPINMWRKLTLAMDEQGYNCSIVFDKDGMLLLEMIINKLRDFLSSGELGVVQDVICEGAIEKINTLMRFLHKNEQEFDGIDIHALGNATFGFDESQLVDYIGNVLRNSGSNTSNINKFMSAVSTYHAYRRIEQSILAKRPQGNVDAPYDISSRVGRPGPSRNEFGGPQRDRGGYNNFNKKQDYDFNRPNMPMQDRIGFGGPPGPNKVAPEPGPRRFMQNRLQKTGGDGNSEEPNKGGFQNPHLFNSSNFNKKSGNKFANNYASGDNPQPGKNKPNVGPYPGGSYNGGNKGNFHGSGMPPQSNFKAPAPTNYGPPKQPDYGPPKQSDYGPPKQSDYGPPKQSDYGPPNQSDYGPPSHSMYGPPAHSNYGPPAQTTYTPTPYGSDYGYGGYDQSYNAYNQAGYYGYYGTEASHSEQTTDQEFIEFKNSGIPISILRKYKNYTSLDSTEQENARMYLQNVEAYDMTLANKLRVLMSSSN